MFILNFVTREFKITVNIDKMVGGYVYLKSFLRDLKLSR